MRNKHWLKNSGRKIPPGEGSEGEEVTTPGEGKKVSSFRPTKNKSVVRKKIPLLLPIRNDTKGCATHTNNKNSKRKESSTTESSQKRGGSG